jgi:hypothetical protein
LRKTTGILLLTVLALTSSLIAATTPQAYAYKQSIDVPLSNGHHVTVHFADNFPDQLLQTHVGYMQMYIPRVAELFYMPDHDFTIVYDAYMPPNGCEATGRGGSGGIWICPLNLDRPEVVGTIAHELTHVFQAESSSPYSQSLNEASATAVATILVPSQSYWNMEYSMIAENGPGMQANAQVEGSYLLSTGFEKLYAYHPTFFREHTSQAAALQDQDPYYAILGEAVLDSRPLSRWVYDQGIGPLATVPRWGPFQQPLIAPLPPAESGIYPEIYATYNHDGTNGYFWAQAWAWQWNAEQNMAVALSAQSFTCRVYRLNGEYLAEAQAAILEENHAACNGFISSIPANTNAVRIDVHMEAGGEVVDRTVIAFRYQNTDGPSNSWLGMVDGDRKPVLVNGAATINVQTITGMTQTLQAPVEDGIVRLPTFDTYGVADIDITTPTLNYHVGNYPFTPQPRGVTVTPYIPYLGIHAAKWHLAASETAQLVVNAYPTISGGSLTIQYKRAGGDTWHTLVEGAQLQDGRYEYGWGPAHDQEKTDYILRATWTGAGGQTVESNPMVISWEAGTPPPPPCQDVNTSEGAKIRVGGKVYVIEQGRKRWITSEQILNQCYGGGVGIQDVTEACANSIPDGPDITSCETPPPLPPPPVTCSIGEGVKIRDTRNGRIYIIQGGQKHWIVTEDLLNKCYGGWAGIQDVPGECADSIQSGSDATDCESPPQPPPENPPRRCIIATAAYGSEMVPEVAYMRYVRDQIIGSTPTGKILRDVFNAFYYSWSPPVAEAIAANPLLQAIFRMLLQPLVWIIHIAAYIFAAIAALTGNADAASAVAFMAAAAMTIGAYIIAPAVAVRYIVKHLKNLSRRPGPCF